MSKWGGQGECTECCRSCILDDGVLFCKRKHKVIDPDHVGIAGVCNNFKLSDAAMVNRYVTARKASRRAGVGYDCDLSRFRALPEAVQEEIKRQLKGRVTD